jgi:hypothetical protein
LQKCCCNTLENSIGYVHCKIKLVGYIPWKLI